MFCLWFIYLLQHTQIAFIFCCNSSSTCFLLVSLDLCLCLFTHVQDAISLTALKSSHTALPCVLGFLPICSSSIFIVIALCHLALVKHPLYLLLFFLITLIYKLGIVCWDFPRNIETNLLKIVIETNDDRIQRNWYFLKYKCTWYSLTNHNSQVNIDILTICSSLSFTGKYFNCVKFYFCFLKFFFLN